MFGVIQYTRDCLYRSDEPKNPEKSMNSKKNFYITQL